MTQKWNKFTAGRHEIAQKVFTSSTAARAGAGSGPNAAAGSGLGRGSGISAAGSTAGTASRAASRAGGRGRTWSAITLVAVDNKDTKAKVDCGPGVPMKRPRFGWSGQIYSRGAQGITTAISMRDHGGIRRDYLKFCYELINYAVRIVPYPHCILITSSRKVKLWEESAPALTIMT